MDLQKTVEWFKSVLRRNEYGLTQCQYGRICSLLENVCVYYPNSETDFTEIAFKDEAGESVFRREVRSEPQAIDVVPMCIGDELKYIRPVMLLGDLTFWNGDRIKEMWTAMHEICHLLSIGDYVRLKDEDAGLWRHTYGINEYFYEERAGYLRKIKFNGNARVNEWFNEYATRCFACLMNAGQIPLRKSQKIFNEITDRNCMRAGIAEEEIIGAYFSGNVEMVRNVLLSDEVLSYDNLEEYILRIS
ncbi:MAG: hypothetical protein LUG52_07025 [Clostridia bacterium]|nr:hypothetical protein [Clostridia bacterium]